MGELWLITTGRRVRDASFLSRGWFWPTCIIHSHQKRYGVATGPERAGYATCRADRTGKPWRRWARRAVHTDADAAGAAAALRTALTGDTDERCAACRRGAGAATNAR